MSDYTVEYAPGVEGDLDEIGHEPARRVLRKIDETLTSEPNQYGDELTPPLAGYRKLPVGQYRVIYRAPKDSEPRLVLVLKVGIRAEGDRRDIYRSVSPAGLDERKRELLKRLAQKYGR